MKDGPLYFFHDMILGLNIFYGLVNSSFDFFVNMNPFFEFLVMHEKVK